MKTTHRRSPPCWIRIGTLFAAIVTAAGAVDATTLLKKNLDDLVREADAIVVGTVSEIQAQSDAGGGIHSFVTLANLQVIHGDYQDDSLTLRFEGGRVGQDVRFIIGSPQFQPHDRVLVFIQGNGQYLVPVVGWTQGVFRLTFDPDTGRERIFDHDRNPVLEIRGRELLKRRLNPSAAEIVGDRPSIDDEALAARVPLGAEEFLAEVGRRADRIGARGRMLRSIAPAPAEERR
jgi:hypothetical protein